MLWSFCPGDRIEFRSTVLGSVLEIGRNGWTWAEFTRFSFSNRSQKSAGWVAEDSSSDPAGCLSSGCRSTRMFCFPLSFPKLKKNSFGVFRRCLLYLIYSSGRRWQTTSFNHSAMTDFFLQPSLKLNFVTELYSALVAHLCFDRINSLTLWSNCTSF